jgi:hypothetical protein
VLARAGGGPADELCDALLDAAGPDGNDDDIALLVLQVDEGRGAAGSRS